MCVCWILFQHSDSVFPISIPPWYKAHLYRNVPFLMGSPNQEASLPPRCRQALVLAAFALFPSREGAEQGHDERWAPSKPSLQLRALGGIQPPLGVEAPQVSVGCLIAVIKAGTAGGGQVWVVEMAAGVRGALCWGGCCLPEGKKGRAGGFQ